MNETEGGKSVTIWMDGEILRRLDAQAAKEQRNRSNMVMVLLGRALDGGESDHSPRVARLFVDWRHGLVTGDEAMQQVGRLLLDEEKEAIPTAAPV